MKPRKSMSSCKDQKKTRKRFHSDEDSLAVTESSEARKRRILLKRETAKQEYNGGTSVESERNNVLISKDKEENPSSKDEDSDENEKTDAEEKKAKLDIPDSRVIVANVFRFLEQEYKFMQMKNVDNCNLRPLAAIQRRTAEATGVTRDVIRGVVRADRSRIAAKRTRKNQRSQQSSQGTHNIIKTGHHQDRLNTRHTINVIVNNNKRERQKRYREQNREKLKQREAERRKRIQCSQSIAVPSSSTNTNGLELNDKEIITDISQNSSGLEEAQPSSIQRNEQGKEMNALQKKRERQQRYREQNRDKLKQREAERRRRLQNTEIIKELSSCPNIETTEMINEPISANSGSVAGLEEVQHVVVEVDVQSFW